MKLQHCYSTVFTTEYDEPVPRLDIDGGCRLTVLSAIQWLDSQLRLMREAKLQRLAIIWAEYYDDRLMPVLESALIQGLLAPVLVVGVRQWSLNVVLRDDDPLLTDLDYINSWTNVSNRECEQWFVTIGTVENCARNFIKADGDSIVQFMNAIFYNANIGLQSYAYRSFLVATEIGHCSRYICPDHCSDF